MPEFLEQYITEHKLGETFYGDLLPDALREVFQVLEKQNHSGYSWSIMMMLIPEIDKAYKEYIEEMVRQKYPTHE